MHNPTTGEDIITLTWDTRCHTCGCTIPAGSKAAYVKDTGLSRTVRRQGHSRIYANADASDEGVGMVRTLRRIKAGSRVTHCQADPCGGSYTIKAIYHSTSKAHAVQAYSAREALNAIMGKRIPANQPHPSCYIVYQGNVPVLTEVAR